MRDSIPKSGQNKSSSPFPSLRFKSSIHVNVEKGVVDIYDKVIEWLRMEFNNILCVSSDYVQRRSRAHWNGHLI